MRVRSRRGEGDRLRDEILDAVGALLDETNDEAAVSIRAIAERVGVSPPSIYRHFEDKEALLNAVCGEVFAQLQVGIAHSISEATGPLDALALATHYYVDFGLAHPEHYRLVFMRPPPADDLCMVSASVGTSPQPTAGNIDAPIGGAALAASQAFDALYNLVSRVLAALPKRKRLDEFTATTMFWGAMHGITSLRITNPDFAWPSVDAQIDALLWPWRQAIAGK